MNADEHRDLRKLLELLERAKRWEELTGNPSDELWSKAVDEPSHENAAYLPP
jgi:hypothetical protein